MKRAGEETTEEQNEIAMRVLQAVINRMRMPLSLFGKAEYSDEDENYEEYLSYREEIGKSLFLNLASIKGPPFQTYLFNTINTLLTRLTA